MTVHFTVNGAEASYSGAPVKRLADVLRDDLELTGTKVGCNAGDCGACTVLVDGAQTCACMVPVGQMAGRAVTTVEGLAKGGGLNALQAAFHRHGAAQCGICTPGMLMAATDLLSRQPNPTEQQVKDGLGGVLCRCTGYRKIIEAVCDVAGNAAPPVPPAGQAVGARMAKLDGLPKLTGEEKFGADDVPTDALWLRMLRSPHAAARFKIGDVDGFVAANPGLVRVFSAADVPFNGFGIYPDLKDQPVLAESIVRHYGEPVLAVVGERAAVETLRDADWPVVFTPLDALLDLDAATAEGARALHKEKHGNVLIEGRVRRGDVEAALATSAAQADGRFETSCVEHAYIEPEAGWARRVGSRIEVHVSTQTPYMDRDEVAAIMRFMPERIRITPTACGGGFGGKLDLSVQPLVALAAWVLERPVACVYHRPESMAATTKRHAARIHARMACDAEGRLQAVDFTADFDTGAYASWGPTVAGRVPVHASGPYAVPNVRARGRAIYTNGPVAGAFRGFGVPQAAIAHETLMDDLALAVGKDRLEFRLINALRAGQSTATGQVLAASAGLAPCLEALAPAWHEALADAAEHNARRIGTLRGVGVGCMWYGIGNTSMSNPSNMRLTLAPDGTLTYYNGAVDIGQGATTILSQIVADALGVTVDTLTLVVADTDLTADAGKSSASRQTFVSGHAAMQAGRDLRAKILRLANAGEGAAITLEGSRLSVRDGDAQREIALDQLEEIYPGVALDGTGRFDPPTTPLDADGQGVPYATYGFAAQIAVADVDPLLGTTTLKKIVAAHDVGRAINPTQVEGQIHGGIAQGIGLALMEEYLPGKTDDLHNYLIPTFGDVPEIDVIIVEDPEPLGPYGAKGVGEPGLVPTAPAILGAIRYATGVRITRVPVLPHRLRAAIVAMEADDGER